MRAPPAPLHPIIAVGPFAKWGIDFITCNPHSAGGHAYIILAVDYLTKWAEVMPTFSADGKIPLVDKSNLPSILRISRNKQRDVDHFLYTIFFKNY